MRGIDVSLWNCATHPTGGYFALLAVPYRLSGAAYASIVAVNTALGALAIAALGDLAARMFPEPEARAERGLATVAVALNPVLLACTLQLTPDFAVAVFSALALWALARGRTGAAVVAGALACFSKETGAAIYLGAVGAYAVTWIDWAAGPGPARRDDLRRVALLLLGPAAWAGYLVARALLGASEWHGNGGHISLWRHALSINLTDNVLPTQLAQVFVLNFAWVLLPFLALALASRAAAGLARWLRAEAPAHPPDPAGRAVRLVVLAFAVAVVAVTRFRTFVIPRYVLPASLLLPLVALAALRALDVRGRSRAALLAIFVALTAASIGRTRDGLSMSLFGTIEFGRHRLLNVGRPAGWPGGGEQMVYNLEFAHVGRLLREATPRLMAGGQHALAFHRDESHTVFGWIDPRTGRVGPYRPGAVHPHIWTLPEVAAQADRPARVYYVELPGREDEDELIGWSRYYAEVGSWRRERDGYAVTVHELSRRAAPRE